MIVINSKIQMVDLADVRYFSYPHKADHKEDIYSQAEALLYHGVTRSRHLWPLFGIIVTIVILFSTGECYENQIKTLSNKNMYRNNFCGIHSLCTHNNLNNFTSFFLPLILLQLY